MSASTLRVVARSCALGLALLFFASAQFGCTTSSYDQGRRALRNGDADAALMHFDQAIEAGIDVFEARRERAAAQLSKGEIEVATADLESLRGEDPTDSRTLWLLGQAYSTAGRHSEAAEVYRAYASATDSEATREKAELRVAQLERVISKGAAQSIVSSTRSGEAPEPNSVAVVAFLAPTDGATVAPESDLATRDARIRRALVAFASADLAKVSAVEVIADDMMADIRDELQFTYDNRRYFEQGSLVAQGGSEPAQHLVYGYFEGVDPVAVRMGAVHHEIESGTAPCSAHDGEFSELMDLETDVVIDVLVAMNVTPTAAERLAIGDKPTRNLEAFIAFGEGLRQRDMGNYGEAAKAFSQAASLDPGFSMASQQATSAQAASMGANAVVVPPPPAPIETAASRAASSSSVLGFGMTPTSETPPGGGGSTTDLVTVRGTATIGVTGRANPNSDRGGQ